MLKDLIKLQKQEKWQFHRVLYFLPCRGPLERANTVLKEEIKLIHRFFGNAIFDHMVLVVTFHELNQPPTLNKKGEEVTRKNFEEVWMSAIGGVHVCPKCPVLFIGFNEASVDLQHRIETADVVSNEVLTLDSCAKV